VSLSSAIKAQTDLRSGQVMTAMPSDLSTRRNSDRAKGTSWGYRCSMLWEEKTASTDSEETEDMSVMVPTRSGLTDSSMSKRSSFQEDRALVVRSLRLAPQPTWRKDFIISPDDSQALAGRQFNDGDISLSKVIICHHLLRLVV
jgi:hypothetical protein